MDNQEQNFQPVDLAYVPKRERFLNRGEMVLALFSFTILFLIFGTSSNLPKNNTFKIPASVASVEEVEKEFENPFDKVEIKAKSAYVLDIKSNKVFFEKDSDAQLPLASITKVMTAVSALSLVPESTIINIDKSDLVLEGDGGLFANEKWRLGDLLNLTLIESSNDGAYAVSSKVGSIFAPGSNEVGRKYFLSFMNQKAKELGLTQTYFNNESGLDVNNFLSGGYGSARDVAQLMGYAVTKYPNVFRNTKYDELKVESLSKLGHKAVNTNKTVNSIPGIIASKTGYTELAGGNLAVVFDAGFGSPVAVVLKDFSHDHQN
jgi:D-alanyl-D-alanine carboxypeptidase